MLSDELVRGLAGLRLQVASVYATRHPTVARFGSDAVRPGRPNLSALAEVVYDVQVGDVVLDGDVQALGSGHIYLFHDATGEVVIALVLSVNGDRELTGLLEACRHGKLVVDGKPLARYVDDLVSRHIGAADDLSDGDILGSETYQLIYVADGGVVEYDGRSATVVSAGAAVVRGPGGPIPDLTMRFTASLVATSAHLRHIQEASYRALDSFRNEVQRSEAGQVRSDLEMLFDELGNLSFDLALVALAEGVVRSRVPDSFHADLVAQFALEGRMRSTMEALAQIERSIDAEMSAIAIRESRTASATSLSTAITVPISFLGAFFGLGTSDVSGHSIFDVRHFYYVYLVALLLAAVPLVTTWIGRRRARGAWHTAIRRLVTGWRPRTHRHI
jgi:hypothetical protein